MSEADDVAAQAVLDAYKDASDGDYINGEWIQDHAGQIAAALRALATRGKAVEIRTAPGMAEFDEVIRVSDILSIAAELDPITATSGGDYHQ